MIYKKLLTEIDMYKDRLDDLIKEEYGLNRIKDTHKIRVDKYAKRQGEITNEKIILLSMLEEKEHTLNKIKERLKKLDGLEYKIEYRKTVEGKTLKEIAEELNYNECYIRQIYSKRKHLTKT